MLYAIIGVLFLLADQFIKFWTVSNLELNTGYKPLIENVIHLTYIKNFGAAFGVLSGVSWLRWALLGALALFTLFIVLGLGIGYLRTGFARWTGVLLLAGLLGNGIDRAIYGYVVDMLELDFMKFAIFNLADVLVVLFGILFCIALITGGIGAPERAYEEERPVRRRRPVRMVDDEDEEEEPSRRRRPRPVREEDEEDEEEEAPRRRRPRPVREEDEEDEEEEAPRKRRPRPVREEDEEEAPRRRRIPAAQAEEREHPRRSPRSEDPAARVRRVVRTEAPAAQDIAEAAAQAPDSPEEAVVSARTVSRPEDASVRRVQRPVPQERPAPRPAAAKPEVKEAAPKAVARPAAPKAEVRPAAPKAEVKPAAAPAADEFDLDSILAEFK